MNLIDDIERVSSITEKLYKGGESGVREYRFRHKNTGEYVWLEDKISFKKVGDKGYEVTVEIPKGFKAAAFEGQKSVKVTVKDGKLKLTMPKDKLMATTVHVEKMTSKAKPGETGGVFHVYFLKLKDFFPKDTKK